MERQNFDRTVFVFDTLTDNGLTVQRVTPLVDGKIVKPEKPEILFCIDDQSGEEEKYVTVSISIEEGKELMRALFELTEPSLRFK